MLALFACGHVWGQTPVPEADTVPPIKEGDPALRQLPPREDYSDDRERMMPEELPDPVKQTLESNALYSGWEKAQVFRDKTREEFIVEFKDRGKPATYRFNKEGRPVLEK